MANPWDTSVVQERNRQTKKSAALKAQAASRASGMDPNKSIIGGKIVGGSGSPAAERPRSSSNNNNNNNDRDDSPPPRQEERYWYQPDWRDSAYNQQLASINRALADFETELGLQGQRYGTDYTQSVRELGYRPGEGFSPTVDVLNLPGTAMARTAGGTPSGADALSAIQQAMMPVTGYDQNEAGPMARSATPKYSGGQWDYEGDFNPFSAASRGTRSTRDDFAGRGMIRSSDFAQTYADFQDRMQNQLQSMERGRTRFFEDAALEAAQRRSSAEERRQAARVNAMARAAQAGEYRTR
jgi:hypothetical protein